jgi:preprotein translocase subunit Sec63
MAPLLSEEEIALGDPYEILGVPVDATEKQIQSAYRKLSIKSHPDRVSSFRIFDLNACRGLMLFCFSV